MDRRDAIDLLNAKAEDAQRTAAGLNKFLKPVPESKVEIAAAIAKCFEVNSALHRVCDALKDTRGSLTYRRIASDVQDVANSLNHTLEDIKEIIGKGFEDAKNAKISTNVTFRKVWRNIKDHFRRQSGVTLSQRLEDYRDLLIDLTDMLYDGSARDPESFNQLAKQVSELLGVQEAELQNVLEWPEGSNASSSPGPSKKKPSFERKRPAGAFSPTVTHPRQRPILKTGGHQPPMQPGRARNRLPPAPEVPVSDTSTEYSNDSFVSSASHMASMCHWIQKVFERSPPSTKLSETGQPSVCLDENNPRALEWLEDDYVKLLELAFENGDLMVSFYLRIRDGRARLLCEKIRPEQQRKDCTICLTNLDVDREGQFLKFFRVDADQRSHGLWCCLRFRSYEQLVLFFCTFIALRSQDNSRPLSHIEDWRLGREKVLFTQNVIDDQFEHRLMLLRDEVSGGIRLQASIARGELKHMPVWTAFITHQIHSRRWMKPSGETTVLLADLYRYVFDNEYSAPIASGGEHDLTFKDKDDADEFMDAIEDLVE